MSRDKLTRIASVAARASLANGTARRPHTSSGRASLLSPLSNNPAAPAAAGAGAAAGMAESMKSPLPGVVTRGEVDTGSDAPLSGRRLAHALAAGAAAGDSAFGDNIVPGRLSPVGATSGGGSLGRPSPGASLTTGAAVHGLTASESGGGTSGLMRASGGGSGCSGSESKVNGGSDASGEASGEQGGARYPTGHIGVSDEKGQRNYMEDRHTLIPDFKLLNSEPGLPRQFVAVYDGHSSHHGSEHASRRVHEFIAAQPAIQQCKGGSYDHIAVEAALKKAFEGVDQEIVDTAVQGGKRYGTTAVCALRIGNTVYVAHAGDSRAVLCREGKAITLTQDHKPASVPEERERIEAQGGRIAYEADRVLSNPEGERQSRLNMSRALGDPDFKEPRRLVECEPDVARVQLKRGADQFLLLASDGLFDVMSDQQAVELACSAIQCAKEGPSDGVAEAAADVLVQQALRAGTHDNVTAVLMLFDWA